LQSMTFDPASAGIGARVVENAAQGLDAASAAATSIAGLVPAGSDEVSLRAAAAFAEEAVHLLSLSQAAQEELMRTGEAFTQVARMYIETDETAARRVSATPFGRYELARV
jgi:PE family